MILFDRKIIYFYLFCLLFIWIIFRMAKFLQMNSQRPSMLPPKAKLFPAYPLHSNFSLKINSEHLMLTVRSLIYTFIYYYWIKVWINIFDPWKKLLWYFYFWRLLIKLILFHKYPSSNINFFNDVSMNLFQFILIDLLSRERFLGPPPLHNIT